MLILDTNVISEFVAVEPDPHVLDWAEAHWDAKFYLTAITLAEIDCGLARMPEGRAATLRRHGMMEAIERFIVGPPLAFDEVAARTFGPLFARCEKQGQRMQFADAQIAAIALANGGTLVTRNVADFAASGIPLINPFAPT